VYTIVQLVFDRVSRNRSNYPNSIAVKMSTMHVTIDHAPTRAHNKTRMASQSCPRLLSLAQATGWILVITTPKFLLAGVFILCFRYNMFGSVTLVPDLFEAPFDELATAVSILPFRLGSHFIPQQCEPACAIVVLRSGLKSSSSVAVSQIGTDGICK